MGKEWAERSNEQSNHASRRTVPKKSVSSTLLELREKARKEPKYRFRSLYREINLPMLYECFYDLKRSAATGVDGVSVEDYEKDLDGNLRGLLGRLIGKRYRAQHVRRRYIPKGGGKMRPLGIPALEDKVVQMAASKLLQAIYEADFLDESKGYRPKRGARDASQELRERLFSERVHWVVEADIKGFFENVDHDWLERMLRQRVDDTAFIRLIRKWRSDSDDDSRNFFFCICPSFMATQLGWRAFHCHAIPSCMHEPMDWEVAKRQLREEFE